MGFNNIQFFLLRNSLVPPTFVLIIGILLNIASAIEYPKPSKSLVSDKKISKFFKIDIESLRI